MTCLIFVLFNLVFVGIDVPRQTIQIISEDDSSDRRLQSVTLYNTLSPPLAPSSAATIVQYTHGPDGQYFIPGTEKTPKKFYIYML